MLASVWTNYEELINCEYEPQMIRNTSINLTNAVIFRSFTVEGTLSGHDSCNLKCNFCPQARVAPVTHIQVYFT